MRFLILLSLAIIGCGSAKHQQSEQARYILIQLFSDPELTKRDSVTSVDVASIEGNIKKNLERKDKHVFLSQSTTLKRLRISSGDSTVDFEFPPGALRSSFIVINAYLNPSAAATNASVTAHRGDVVYVNEKCNGACHRIQIRNASVIKNQNGDLSTGYNALDPFILNK